LFFSGLTSRVTSNHVNQQKHTHQFSDISAEPHQIVLSIQGFDKMPLVSFVPDVEQMV
jgi:hypothetical protein